MTRSRSGRSECMTAARSASRRRARVVPVRPGSSVCGCVQAGDRVADDARGLHLRDADALADLSLGEVLLEAQAQHLALARGDVRSSWASVARSSARPKPCSVLARCRRACRRPRPRCRAGSPATWGGRRRRPAARRAPAPRWPQRRARSPPRWAGGARSLPTGAWIMPVLSTRNSTLPALISLTALAISKVTVPVFGFGISPQGAEDLAEAADRAHHVGRRDNSVEIHPAAVNLVDDLFAGDVMAPASCASFCFSPPAMASTFLLLPSLAAARPCRGPSDRRVRDRRRAGPSTRRFHQTSRI